MLASFGTVVSAGVDMELLILGSGVNMSPPPPPACAPPGPRDELLELPPFCSSPGCRTGFKGI